MPGALLRACDLQPVVEPGRFEIWVGPSAEEGLVQAIELLVP